MDRLEKEMKATANFVTQAEIKVCLNCGGPYSVKRRRCPDCRRREHTKTLLIFATWTTLPPHLADGRPGPGVRVTNFGGNAV
mgnify:FL=1